MERKAYKQVEVAKMMGVHRNSVYQLSFYAMALERLGYPPKKLAPIWLPKRKKGKLVYVDRVPNERLLEVLREYETNSK